MFGMLASNMRTLGVQVKLRRLIRVFDEAVERLSSEPFELRQAGSVVGRLLELSAELREAWASESLIRPTEPALERYVTDSLRSIDFAIAGLGQAGANLELVRADFESAALPLEVFLRGLDTVPALQRSA